MDDWASGGSRRAAVAGPAASSAPRRAKSARSGAVPPPRRRWPRRPDRRLTVGGTSPALRSVQRSPRDLGAGTTVPSTDGHPSSAATERRHRAPPPCAATVRRHRAPPPCAATDRCHRAPPPTAATVRRHRPLPPCAATERFIIRSVDRQISTRRSNQRAARAMRAAHRASIVRRIARASQIRNPGALTPSVTRIPRLRQENAVRRAPGTASSHRVRAWSHRLPITSMFSYSHARRAALSQRAAFVPCAE